MKFGKNLECNKVPEFSAHYINYKGLKKLIKQVNTGHDALDPDPDLTGFFYELDRNLEDVDTFFNKRSAETARRLKRLEGRFQVGPVSDLNRLDLPSEEWEELVAAMVDLRSSLQKLMWFADVNKQGMVKILKKLEKKTAFESKSVYLDVKVDILPFSNPVEMRESLQFINRWLSKIVPSDMKNMTEISANDNLRRVRSMVHMGVAVEQASVLEQLISSDECKALTEIINTLSPAPTNRVLTTLLQQALLRRSFACAKVLLNKLDSLLMDEDINERNVFHKLIILQGRLVCKTKDGKRGSPLAEEMFITPAIPPATNLSIGNPALDFGNRTRDDVKEDDPVALKFLLAHLSQDLRKWLNHRDSHQRLPLHYAAEFGLEKCSQVIISHMLMYGFLKPIECLEDPRFADSDGLTPVHLCIRNQYPVTLHVLLQAGSIDAAKVYETRRIRLGDGLCVNPMSLAIGCPKIIRILIDFGMDINRQNLEGETCIHEAARSGDVQSLQEFLKPNELQKANLYLAEKTYGWTALFVAAVEGQKDAVAILAAATPDSLDNVDLSGWTAMEHATFRGHFECGKLLRPTNPPGPNSTFDQRSRPKLSSTTSGIIEQISRVKSPDFASKPVKSFGHRYLKDYAMIILTLGTTDTRRKRGPVQLERVPIADAGTTRLDTALSLVISAKNAVGDVSTFDLPMGDNPATEPILFTTTNPDAVQLYFDIVPTYAGSGAKKLGRAVALLSTIKTSVGAKRASLWGSVVIPIIESEDLSVIGTVEFEFSIVTPFSHPQMSIEKESTYWKSLMSTRVIGHRGLGKNVNQPDRKSLQLGENTVQSFVAAANLGASYVEFDVQITKDLVPVIYHDFLVSQTGIDAPVHALTLDQFMSTSAADSNGTSRNSSRDRVRALQNGHLARGRSRSLASTEILENLERMKHTRDFKIKGFKGNQRGHSVQDAFSTLAEVFKKVPQNVGFNIECKYPMLSEAEEEEMDNTAIEINQWVDTVLKCVYDHGNGRDIIFSSFHPDVCLLLALKQPTIPCLFLTESGTTYLSDVRASSLQEAIRFASRWNLLGIVSACEPFVMCPRLVRVVKESGLVCVSYGMLNNEPEHVNAQVAAGVDAVIVDSVLAIRKGLTSSGTS